MSAEHDRAVVEALLDYVEATDAGAPTAVCDDLWRRVRAALDRAQLQAGSSQ